MIQLLSASTLGLMAVTAVPPAIHAADPVEDRVFEMRVYYAAPGKLEALLNRFRDHTVDLFTKHGMTNVGYYVPEENPENKLIYFLAYPSLDARGRAWKGFMADPDWQAAWAASKVDGPLVSRVDKVFMKATDYSPRVGPSHSNVPRTFELRTYLAAEGKLDALHARFRDHTLELFSNHGMTHIGYWTPTEGEDGFGDTLIYLIAHDSKPARDASFDGFRKDPKWLKAKSDSEANGSLTRKVESILLKPTFFSAIR